MIRRLLPLAALVSALSIGACEKQLTVTNANSGDTKRVLGTPDDAEALVATYYKRWSSGLYGSTTVIESMADIFSMQNYSSLANNCMNSHAPFSGATNVNAPGNTCGGEQFRLYSYMSEVNRVAASFLTQVQGGLTLGSPARDARAKSWSNFLIGLSTGYLSLMHDSGSVVTVGQTNQDPGVLVGYRALNDSSMAAFQRAIDEASKPNVTSSSGFPIPTAWLPSPTTWSTTEFIKLIRSYRARIRANVARTPEERAALDWNAIIADAQNGITADHLIITSTTQGPTQSLLASFDGAGTWHQMTPFIIGMADVSGSYAAWTAQPISERGSGNQSFFMVTPDLRFPQGTSRVAQQADFSSASCQAAATPCKRYFVNRPAGGDQFAGLGWGWSNYDFIRFHSWRVSGDGTAQNGKLPFMTKAEIDLLRAEGLYRKGDYAGAAGLVNLTRVPNGLPAITAFDATSPVPGGAATCVPRIPVAPFNVVACGNLWEALKYEKRIETAYTHSSAWYLDSRGWGDLAAETPLFWAVPYQDLQARGYSTANIYGAGVGAGNAPNSFVAKKGTYGW